MEPILYRAPGAPHLLDRAAGQRTGLRQRSYGETVPPLRGRRQHVAGLFVAAGFSGTGFKTAPAVGASMAELILDGASKTVDLTPFSFERILSGRMIESPNEYEMGAGFGHKL